MILSLALGRLVYVAKMDSKSDHSVNPGLLLRPV